jgi:putative transposase
MPRHQRHVATGHTFHVTNRGVERRTLFRKDADYRFFLALLEQGKGRFAVRLFALCLMPNHFHLVVRPDQEGALSAYFHWVQGCYSRHLRTYTHTEGQGHVFQQRFWSGPIEDATHFLNVLRYVEFNPAAARLVERAEHWPWNSLALRRSRGGGLLDPLPFPLPPNWADLVNQEPVPEEAD